jgi:hypothetical protein
MFDLIIVTLEFLRTMLAEGRSQHPSPSLPYKYLYKLRHRSDGNMEDLILSEIKDANTRQSTYVALSLNRLSYGVTYTTYIPVDTLGDWNTHYILRSSDRRSNKGYLPTYLIRFLMNAARIYFLKM